MPFCVKVRRGVGGYGSSREACVGTRTHAGQAGPARPAVGLWAARLLDLCTAVLYPALALMSPDVSAAQVVCASRTVWKMKSFREVTLMRSPVQQGSGPVVEPWVSSPPIGHSVQYNTS